VHDHPERCRTLTLAATSAGFVMVPGNLRALTKMATPRRYTDPNYMIEVGPDIYGGQLRLDRRKLMEHAAAMRANTPRGYLYQLLAGVGWTSWLWLPRMRLPVLIMMGADDPIVPLVNGRILAGRLPDARLEVVDCGHLFILTHAEHTASTIEGFLLEARKTATE
jgi:poly(3-hydroxyoctanoate) depolymerase